MSRVFYIFTIALITLCFSSLYAQDFSRLGNICLSPPLPPYFKPINNVSLPSSRSGNNYQIPFDTILFNPLLGAQAFDVVICIDGAINNSQIAIADNYIDSLVSTLHSVAHYNARFKYFNIYRVAKLSNQEGSAWGLSGDTSVDNRYGSRFNAFNLSRLLLPEKVDTLFADVAAYVPDYDLVLMLTYDKKYGGSGWSLYDGRKVASFSIDQETGWHLSDEVIIHEMQHIMPFAGHGYLGDEYEDSISCAIYDSIPESPNYTNDTMGKRKWDHCIGFVDIGFYPEAGICTGNFRPSSLCIMRQVYNLPDFCAVCRENSTAYFDSVINPVYYSSPAPANYTGTQLFSVAVDTPLINTFRYKWLLDDSLVAIDIDSVIVDFGVIDKSANHTLKFVCTDIDPFIIDSTLRRPWITEWSLLTKDTIASIHEQEGSTEWNIFPNPVKSQLQVRLKGNYQETLIEIVAPDCRIAMKNVRADQHPIGIDVTSLLPGIYFLVIKNEKEMQMKKFVKL